MHRWLTENPHHFTPSLSPVNCWLLENCYCWYASLSLCLRAHQNSLVSPKADLIGDQLMSFAVSQFFSFLCVYNTITKTATTKAGVTLTIFLSGPHKRSCVCVSVCVLLSLSPSFCSPPKADLIGASTYACPCFPMAATAAMLPIVFICCCWQQCGTTHLFHSDKGHKKRWHFFPFLW